MSSNYEKRCLKAEGRMLRTNEFSRSTCRNARIFSFMLDSVTWTLHSQNATRVPKLRNSANWAANGSAHNWCSTHKWREYEHGWASIDCQKLTSHGLWSFESGNVLPNSSQATARESPTFITDKNRLPSSIAAISVDPENTLWYRNLMIKFGTESWNKSIKLGYNEKWISY